VLQAVPKTANASPSGVQARLFFMPSHYVQSMAKPTGSKAASLIFYFESHPHKNATQRYCGMPPHKAAKRLRHKNTAPTHGSHHFYSVSFWLWLMPLMPGR